jgi:hypothetical protein
MMIIFKTEFAEYFNKNIHEFLLVELFDVYREEDFLKSSGSCHCH